MAAALAYQGDTIANPHESRSLDCFLAREARYLAPQFCRSRRKPRYSAGFQAEPGANCGSWAKVLDVGCGDGTIDALIQQKRPDVSIRGVDVLLRPATRIPVDLFDGKKFPFDDGSFDTCLFVDVLHHTTDPLIL